MVGDLELIHGPEKCSMHSSPMARHLMRALGVTKGLSAAATKALRRVWASLTDDDRADVLGSRKLLSRDIKAALTSLVCPLLEMHLRALCREKFHGAAALSAAITHSDARTLEGMMQHARRQDFGLSDQYARARTASVSEHQAAMDRQHQAAMQGQMASRKRRRPMSGSAPEFLDREAVHSGTESEGDSDSDGATLTDVDNSNSPRCTDTHSD